MNTIIIKKNKIISPKQPNILIKKNQITFTENGEYTLEYQETEQVNLQIIIPDHITIKLFIQSIDNSLNVSNHYQLGTNSNLLLSQFYQNKSVKEEVTIDLKGEFSKISSNFSSISNQKEEYHIIVNHNHHHVSSSISNKCIGLDKSTIHFQIDSNLPKGNIDCSMDQTTRILTLGDVDAKIIPNMFIEEDSVEAKHGSIIGSFKEEDIFYLTSRGIPLEEAVLLLIKGFIFSNLLVDMEKRALIFNCIQKIGR